MNEETRIRKVVVPVAGLGTRLLPATKSQPKEMLPVGRKPVVQYVVEEMVSQGLRHLLLVTGSTKRSIEDHLDTDPMLMERLPPLGKRRPDPRGGFRASGGADLLHPSSACRRA